MRVFAIVLVFMISLVPAPSFSQAPVARVSVVAFGLWDEQKVFKLEAERGGSILANYFAAGPRLTVRANTPGRAGATAGALAETLLRTASAMDGERDVLVVFLTSHGAPEGVGVRTGRVTNLVSPRLLGQMLAATGVRHKIIIISACYSGVFADYLANAETLVISAADADHPSFGCTNTATWTYFGQAFLAQALRLPRSLPDAFALATASIARRERAQGFDPSNPQLRGGEAVLRLVDPLKK